MNTWDTNGRFGDGQTKKRKELEKEKSVFYDILNILTITLIEKRAKYTSEEIELMVKDIPQGHSDFARYEEFDYTLEDNDLVSSPVPIIGNPKAHFQSISQTENEIKAAIGVKELLFIPNGKRIIKIEIDNRTRCFQENSPANCNKEQFARAMHRLQDHYAHGKFTFSEEAEWSSLYPPMAIFWAIQELANPGTVFGHILYGSAPDNNPTEWEKANKVTKDWLKLWDCVCNKE